MECRKDCPVIAEYSETIVELHSEVEQMEGLRQQNQASIEENQATATQLAALQNTPDVAEARGLLQEAIVSTGEAEAAFNVSIGAYRTAIEAYDTASEVLLSNCPGKPCQIEDPSNPGCMILACASPGAYDV